MEKEKKFSSNEKNLTRRYLIWCYKTTKEELDKIDRYFTQLDVDGFILKQLRVGGKHCDGKSSEISKKHVDGFEKYIAQKEQNVLKKKYVGGDKKVLNAEYVYRTNRFKAIEKAIRHFLGARELTKICSLYEDEMSGRILEARTHH